MDSKTASGSPKKESGHMKGSTLLKFFTRLFKEKRIGFIGLIIALLLLFTGIFAEVIAPYGVNETNIANRLQPPSDEHLLGTDNTGRDVFSRIVYGARISVIVGLLASLLASVGSITIGVVSGYIGGKFDLIVQRIVDAYMCIPALVMMMVIISLMGTSMWSVIVVLGLHWSFSGSRLIRGAVIGIKENMYIQASVAMGCSHLRIFFRHIIPNVMAPALIYFTTRVPNAIMTEATLSFLGFGIPPPAPSWGGMLSGNARLLMFRAPWLGLSAGIALALVVYGINMFGDALRDLMDPRLRGGGGRFGVGAVKILKAEME